MILKKSNKLRLINLKKAINSSPSKINSNELFITKGKVFFDSTDKNDFLTLDCKKCLIAPGFIDPQVNGFKKCDFWNIPSYEEIDELRLQLAQSGVVAFCPTIITAPHDQILKSIDHINSYIKQSSKDKGARILGIHIEGIFISKFGVHNEKYGLSDLTVKAISPFIKENVILFTLAPELDKTGEAISFLQKNNILVSIGHSNATYNEGKIIFEKYGIKTVTHMFNALRGVEGFSHRPSLLSGLNILLSKLDDEKKINPDKDGIILNILKNKEVLCMVIADGIHVSSEVIKFLKEYKNENHFSLASDLVANEFYESEKEKGKLGGGQNALEQCVQNLINWKVSNIEECLTFASSPIANQLKVPKEQSPGSIAEGKEANIVLWDTDRNCVKGTIIGENVFLNY